MLERRMEGEVFDEFLDTELMASRLGGLSRG
jgi:hypothetical protein